MKYTDAGSIPIYRLNGTNIYSNYVGDLALNLRSVSLNPHAINQINKFGRLIGEHSVFNEISWVNPETELVNHLEYLPVINHFFDTDYWINKIIQFLKNWFIENLKSDEEYWILHSSGGDSRILSAILANLRDEEGFKPNIKFVSWFPEADQAKVILNFLGWKDEFIWLVGENNKQNLNEKNYWNSENYFLYRECGLMTNGEIHPWGSSQSNFWRPYYTDVKHINVVMAMIGDLLMGAHSWVRWGKRFIFSLESLQYSNNFKRNILIGASARYNGLGLLGFKKQFKNLYCPTMEFKFANIGLQIPFPTRLKDNIRNQIQEKLYPGLSKIPNMSSSWCKMKQDNPILLHAQEKFNQSIFVKKMGNTIESPNLIKFISLASLIDYLENNGVSVSFPSI